MSYMTNPTTRDTVRKLKASNIKHARLLVGQSKVHNVIRYMKYWILDLEWIIQRLFVLYKAIKCEIPKYLHSIIPLSSC